MCPVTKYIAGATRHKRSADNVNRMISRISVRMVSTLLVPCIGIPWLQFSPRTSAGTYPGHSDCDDEDSIATHSMQYL